MCLVCPAKIQKLLQFAQAIIIMYSAQHRTNQFEQSFVFAIRSCGQGREAFVTERHVMQTRHVCAPHFPPHSDLSSARESGQCSFDMMSSDKHPSG